MWVKIVTRNGEDCHFTFSKISKSLIVSPDATRLVSVALDWLVKQLVLLLLFNNPWFSPGTLLLLLSGLSYLGEPRSIVLATFFPFIIPRNFANLSIDSQ